MPELPEVQTTVNGLNHAVRGRKIVDIWTDYNKSKGINAKFKKQIIGARIKGARRRAKNVLIDLDNNKTLLVHMKMTGHFVYDRPDYPFVRFRLALENGKELALSDMRRFAKVTLCDTTQLSESPHLKNLGPEPLNANFQLKAFSLQLEKRPMGKIKTVLMDQTVIAGIGNIYSDEILWRAGVHPLSIVSKIPPPKLRLMFTAMKSVLKRGIKLGGDSMSDYRNIEGERGHFQEHHEAYRRTGKKCSRDEGVIKRIVVGGRSAHFCPIHQKLFK